VAAHAIGTNIRKKQLIRDLVDEGRDSAGDLPKPPHS
jgi:hypothetical protein